MGCGELRAIIIAHCTVGAWRPPGRARTKVRSNAAWWIFCTCRDSTCTKSNTGPSSLRNCRNDCVETHRASSSRECHAADIRGWQLRKNGFAIIPEKAQSAPIFLQWVTLIGRLLCFLLASEPERRYPRTMGEDSPISRFASSLKRISSRGRRSSPLATQI